MKNDHVEGPPGDRSHKLRNTAIGLGLAVAVPAITVRVLAERLRRKPDTEAGEDIFEDLGGSAGYLESFDGTRLYVEALGSGPTLVFVHGWFCNTDNWHYQKKELCRDYRIICYDQRGHRRSQALDGADFSLEALALDLKNVLDSYSPDRPVVLTGHSLGGMAILKFAHLFPEELGDRIKGIALVDTTNVPLHECFAGGAALEKLKKPVVEPIFRWAADHYRLADRVKDALSKTSLFLVATRYLGYGSQAPLTHIEYIGEMARTTSMRGVCLSGLGVLGQEVAIPLDGIADSQIPVLIWVGEKDKLIRPEISEKMHLQLPGSEFRVIADAGHPSFMEEYQEFNRAFRDFAEEAFKGADEQ